jgi:predicted nucleic acid-binding protein
LGDKQEPDQDMAVGILNAWVKGEVDLSTPVIWQYDVGNFLGRKMPEAAMENMELLLNLKIRSVNLTVNMFHRCFEWMEKHKVTFYDASYLAVAHEIQSTLITADEKFVKKMGEKDYICPLKYFEL